MSTITIIDDEKRSLFYHPEARIAVGSLQMRRYADRYRRLGVTVKVLADLQAALDWLESVA